jgi:multicomponent Na+:H+ antiporter subunit D
MSDLFALPPFLIVLLAGLALPFLRGPARLAVLLGAPALAWLRVLRLAGAPDACLDFPFLACAVGPFSPIFASAFCLALFLAGLYGARHATGPELSAGYVAGAGALGVAFAGDLTHLAAFWDLTVLASVLVIATARTKESGPAALRYAYMHILGGALLTAGIACHIAQTGGTDVVAFASPESLPSLLALFGVLIGLAAPPVSAWLPDAYANASPFGTVFLSAFAPTAAVYALLALFPGFAPLQAVGLCMAFYGAVYGAMANDIRRILSYATVGGLGCMAASVGIGTPDALLGAAVLAFCHALYRTLLFMATGAVLFRTNESRLDRLGGLCRSMPVACASALVGAAALSAFPLTAGFAAESLLLGAAGQAGAFWIWLGLTASSACTVLYAGVRLPFLVFFGKDSRLRPHDADGGMKGAMALAAGMCVLLGATEQTVYRLLPALPSYSVRTAENFIRHAELLLFPAAAFFFLFPLRPTGADVPLPDVDRLYRTPLARLGARARTASEGAAGGAALLGGALFGLWKGSVGYLRTADHVFARNWSFSDALFWAILLLQGYVFVTLLL